jgi:uncharacterized protein YcfJ
MKKSVLLCSAGLAAAFGAQAQAQESGRVISSTPIVQQVAVPRQVCNNQPVAVQNPRSGAGSAIGAIAGGLLGNTIGHGGGRAAATIIGMAAGAAVGDQVEGSGYQVHNTQHCTTQTFYENRTVGYDVTYEYGGREYTAQMANDPGLSVPLQISPVGASAPTQAPEQIAAAPSSAGVPILASSPQMAVAPAVHHQPVVVVPSTVVYPSSYYYRPYYYPPVGLSLNFGYSRGYGHGHRHGGRHHHRSHRR